MRFISIGFCCQTRFLIDLGGARRRRYPFDWNISSKDFILAALRQDGANFAHAAAEARLFQMPREETCGVRAGEVFFWHDYPRDDARRVAAGWERMIPQVNRKYEALWRRFSRVLRTPYLKKCLVVANSQANLAEFAADDADFAAKFGIDAEFVTGLTDALSAFGARNCRLRLLVRSLPERLALARSPGSPDVRFVGVMSLPADRRVAGAVLGSGIRGSGIWLRNRLPREVCGIYANGMRIVTVDRGAGIVYQPSDGEERPWGEISCCGNDLLLVTAEPADNVWRARYSRGALLFESGSRWERRRGGE
jgi:hypothetical protein